MSWNFLVQNNVLDVKMLYSLLRESKQQDSKQYTWNIGTAKIWQI